MVILRFRAEQDTPPGGYPAAGRGAVGASDARFATNQETAANICRTSPVDSMPYVRTLQIQNTLAPIWPSHSIRSAFCSQGERTLVPASAEEGSEAEGDMAAL